MKNCDWKPFLIRSLGDNSELLVVSCNRKSAAAKTEKVTLDVNAGRAHVNVLLVVQDFEGKYFFCRSLIFLVLTNQLSSRLMSQVAKYDDIL